MTSDFLFGVYPGGYERVRTLAVTNSRLEPAMAGPMLPSILGSGL